MVSKARHSAAPKLNRGRKRKLCGRGGGEGGGGEKAGFEYHGYQRFFLACDEEVRRRQADTSSAKSWRHGRRSFSRGSLFKPTWPKQETAHKKPLAPRVGFESRQASFFFNFFFSRNGISCILNCDDLLGRSVSSLSRSSKVIAVLLIKPTAFWRSTFSVQYMVLTGCAQRLCMRDYL